MLFTWGLPGSFMMVVVKATDLSDGHVEYDIFGPARSSIQATIGSLSGSDLKVARVLLGSGAALMHQSVTDVASAAQVSASSVVRACQRLGYRGFQDVKMAIAQDGTRRVGQLVAELSDDDRPPDVLGKVIAASEAALRNAATTIDPQQFTDAAELISAAARVLFVGVGTSAPLAQDAAYRFVAIGVDADAPPDVHVQHVRARVLRPDDVCVAISHTGATRETLSAVEAARAAGARTIAVTSFVRSPITDLVDVAIVAHSPELSHRIEALSSRIAHMSVLDALLISVAMSSGSRSEAAQTMTADVIAQHRF